MRENSLRICVQVSARVGYDLHMAQRQYGHVTPFLRPLDISHLGVTSMSIRYDGGSDVGIRQDDSLGVTWVRSAVAMANSSPVVPLVYDIVTILLMSSSSSPRTGPAGQCISSVAPHASSSLNTNSSRLTDDAHWVRTANSAGGIGSSETTTRREGHFGAILSNEGILDGSAKMIERGQWFVLGVSAGLQIPKHSHIRSDVRTKRLVQAHSDQSIRMTSHVDQLPFRPVLAPQPYSPSSPRPAFDSVGRTIVRQIGEGDFDRSFGMMR